MERWRLRLTPYSFDLAYKPGRDENNPADFLSRHPSTPAEEENVAEQYVNFVRQHAVPNAMLMDEIREASRSDQVIQKLHTALQTNSWKDKDLIPYKPIRAELLSHDDMILRQTRLLIPEKLQQKAIDLAHIGHQGIVKTKRLLRSKIWFAGIDKMTEQTIKQCIPCQATTRNSTPPEPLTMSRLPAAPWSEVSMDFAGPLPSNDMLLTVVDDYSRFPEVEIINSTAAKTVIPKLDNIFARQGIPETARSDNGPPFNSKDFDQFDKQLGFKHRKVTPLWPQANGEAERFMDPMIKTIRTAGIEKKNWKHELCRFPRQYRATPHTTTGVAPAEALNNRRFRTQLPKIPERDAKPFKGTRSRVQQNVKLKKQTMKSYADTKRRAKVSDIRQGDTVLVRQNRQNKLSPYFDPKPLTVDSKKGRPRIIHDYT
ncbi:uncharacterized protein K02A2.6-like [Lineus longissimus]|uniref:uncharacterized protein K02A2.6-like n=1 Tax=Lineus longissimus TaxID=88925 RepID=UPI00315C9A4D